MSEIEPERQRRKDARAHRLIAHIEEQVEKRQYWNALVACNDLQRALMEAFDEVLKGTEEG